MKIVITALVAIHLAATAWHGKAHDTLQVLLPPEKNAFVYVVILAAPVVAAILIWTRFQKAAIWIFFLSMLGSFLFGTAHHYVMVSNDNIGHLPSGTHEQHAQFIDSALAIALLELAGALYGAYWLGRSRKS